MKVDNQNQNSRYEESMKTFERVAMLTLAGVSVAAAVYCHHEMRKSVKMLNKAAGAEFFEALRSESKQYS